MDTPHTQGKPPQAAHATLAPATKCGLYLDKNVLKWYKNLDQPLWAYPQSTCAYQAPRHLARQSRRSIFCRTAGLAVAAPRVRLFVAWEDEWKCLPDLSPRPGTPQACTNASDAERTLVCRHIRVYTQHWGSGDLKLPGQLSPGPPKAEASVLFQQLLTGLSEEQPTPWLLDTRGLSHTCGPFPGDSESLIGRAGRAVITAPGSASAGGFPSAFSLLASLLPGSSLPFALPSHLLPPWALKPPGDGAVPNPCGTSDSRKP